MSMKGLKIWVTTLIEYDDYGNAKVLRSYAKPALDSTIKGIQGKNKTSIKKSNKNKEIEEKKLW